MTDMQDKHKTESMVRDYLSSHPHFFDANPDILDQMNLSHDSGEAISLVERQVSVLRDRNEEMRDRLDSMLVSARNNELLFEKTKRLVLNLLEADGLSALVDTLYESLGKDYEVEFYSLTFLGEQTQLPQTEARVVGMDKANSQIGNLISSNRAVCGILRESEMTFLFGERGRVVGSVAAVPLIYGNTYAILAVGNSDPNHYKSSMGTLFLSYIAEILNRLIPRYLKQPN